MQFYVTCQLKGMTHSIKVKVINVENVKLLSKF